MHFQHLFPIFRREAQCHRDTPHKPLRELGKSGRGGKSEVIEGQIIFGHDDGHLVRAAAIFPLLAGHVDELIGDRLEEEGGGHGAVATLQPGIYPEFTAREETHLATPWLTLNISNLLIGETGGGTSQCVGGGDTLIDDQIVALDK